MVVAEFTFAPRGHDGMSAILYCGLEIFIFAYVIHLVQLIIDLSLSACPHLCFCPLILLCA
uniref:Uncharacterized protein n=1 Tax=Sphenodon punctatus TaxID=8508 RepID=A0A8D0GZ48_SPHPU